MPSKLHPIHWIKEKLAKLAIVIEEYLFILYEVNKNPRTPFLPKIIVFIALAYALSPIDLIPDFIPVLGYLDDLILLPLLIFIAAKLVPRDV